MIGFRSPTKTPLITPAPGEVRIDGDLEFQGTQNITTTSGTLGLSPAGGLDLTPGNETIGIGANFFNLTERTDPTAPDANQARLYAKDNGAGKTQLVVRFNTGAVQTIATEP